MYDYSKGKIYTIKNSNNTSLIYVGSTIQTLAKRFEGHKTDCKYQKKNRKLYIEVNNDWSNWYIELYELFPCNSKKELFKREGEIIRLIGNLNKNIAGRNRKEYLEDSRDKLLEYSKKYREDNRDKIKKNKKIFRENNRDKINKQSKKYREDNRDKIIEKAKIFRENNRDKNIEKINCECGGYYSKYTKYSHFKTAKHLLYVKNKDEDCNPVLKYIMEKYIITNNEIDRIQSSIIFADFKIKTGFKMRASKFKNDMLGISGIAHSKTKGIMYFRGLKEKVEDVVNE